jgi:P-type conjugative transfer protein TrbJ
MALAQTRWQTSVGAFEDSLKVQAGAVGNMPTNAATLSTLVSASQSASGALQAAQAGNQLLAVEAQEISDLIAVLAAKGRADALEQARAASAESQGQVQYQAFRTLSGYTPGTVTMFGSN